MNLAFAEVHVREQDWKREEEHHDDQAKHSVVMAREGWRQQALLK